MIGRTLGRYRIVAKLGEGGMGSVWRAEDPELRRTVAIKLLSPTLLASDSARQRFHTEARAVARLEHRGIAAVYDVGETDGLAWIAYQFIDGETVATRTAHGPLPLAEARVLTLDVAEALAHAHERGVLHRDVTAGNVMVTRQGRAVLVDFGLARPDQAAHLTRTGEAVGTAGYMAPEVLRGEAADARSDLYGLGAVLYRMLTGRLPFEGGAAQTVLRVLKEPAPPPSEVRPELPQSFERVVLRLLERDPADRQGGAAEVADALRELSPERGPSSIERARRAIARRGRRFGATLGRLGRRRVGIATLASVAFIAVAGWFAAERGWLPGTAKKPPVIAVLPFKNTSADPEEVAYLGEGLGDELVLKLGQAGGYRVLPWTTTRSLGDSKQSPTEIARQLHVDALLVGSFRVDEERVHVTAALVDGRSGVQRWSQSFDELLSDLMAVQSNIATSVAVELKGNIAPSERRALARHPSTSAEAYALFLQGTNFLYSNDYQTRSLAGPFFDRAIKLDPDLAEAYVGRGAALLDQHFRGTSGGVASLRKAEQDFRRALALDPGLTRARRALVGAAYELGRPKEMLQIASEEAKRGDADVEGLLVRAWACMFSGLAETAVPLLERVLELDPSNQEAAWFRVVALEWSDQHARALEAGKAFIRRFGEDPEVYFWMAMASATAGSTNAEPFLRRALDLMGDNDSDLYAVLAATSYFSRHGESARAVALARHWIPILKDRAVLTSDNSRVLGVLPGLEGLAGDTVSMRQSLGVFAERLKSDPDLSLSGFIFALPGLLHSGTPADLQSAVEVASSGDLATLHPINTDWFNEQLGPHNGVPSEPQLSTYRRLQALVRSRVDELRRRYTAAIALHESSS